MSTYRIYGESGDEGIETMVGKTMARIEGREGDDSLKFVATDGTQFCFFHSSDCCESVTIQDIIGDLADLVGHPIVEAEEISSDDEPAPENADSYTWTFYRFSTVKGTVTVRWLGESNGYYSEDVALSITTGHEAPS